MVEMGKVALGAVRALQEPTPFEVFVDGSIVELYFGGEVLTQNYGPSSHLSTRPNISESHSEKSTRVPHCITGAVARTAAGAGIVLQELDVLPHPASRGVRE